MIAVLREPYVYKEYRCERSEWKFFLQMLQEILGLVPWIWKRVRFFKGEVRIIEKAPGDSPGSWYCSAVLIVGGRGKEKWRFCNFYPYNKVGIGERLMRIPFVGLYCWHDGQWQRVRRVY